MIEVTLKAKPYGRKGGFKVVDSNEKRICELFQSDKHLTSKEKKDYAHLFAAAPALAESPRRILKGGMTLQTVKKAEDAMREAGQSVE